LRALETILPKFDSVFSIDCVIFGFDEGELKILLIERNVEPFKDWWALPGYLVEQEESLDNAAERILYELTGLKGIYMDQFYTFGDVAFDKIRNKISYQPIAFELLPEKFTLTQLQHLYEVILNKKLDKRNFRKKMLNYGILKELDEKQKGVSYRAAKLYKFDKRKYARLFQKELSFGK
jgi:8-oxo-dGTP diphosphatase